LTLCVDTHRHTAASKLAIASSKKQWQEAVEAAPASITMKQAVTTTATTTVVGNVKGDNQPAVTADMPSASPTLRRSPAAVTVA